MKFIFGLLTLLNTFANVDSFSMKPMPKQHLVFFPARLQQQFPGEMYNEFIARLKDKYEVHIAGDSLEKNQKLMNNLKETCDIGYDNLGFIAHSSGVADLWNIYDVIQNNNNNNLGVDKIILIEPLDLKISTKLDVNKYVPFVSLINKLDLLNYNFDADILNEKIEEFIETDYLQLLKANIFGTFEARRQKMKGDNEEANVDGETSDTSLDNSDDISCDIGSGKLLVVKHEKSEKWRFVPTVPPLSFLASDLKKFQRNMDIEEVKIKKFGHFDILDRPWANLMKRATLSTNPSNDNRTEYIEAIENLIDDFYS